MSKAEFLTLAKKSGNFDSTAMEFQRHVVMASGIGDESAVPKSVFLPAREIGLREGQEEAALVMVGAVDELMVATGIQPREIEILVVNCGVLTTTPSLSSLLVNHYKLRQDIRSFNLGGMGCAAGVVAVEVARDVLRSRPGSSYALVVSTEIVTSAWYPGSHLQMLTSNCVLCMGAAAMLLSNRRLDWWRSKYQLEKVVRTHKGGGTDERSFNSVCLKEDAEGRRGLYHSHDFLEAASRALKTHMASLGTKKKPDFFQHLCILAASKNLLDEIQQSLELTDEQMEASRKTLDKFGNTSGSSVWYELAYLEAFGRVKKGDTVWQIAIGSGLKCNSMTWKAIRTIGRPQKSPWMENNA